MKVLEVTGEVDAALVLDSPHSGHDFPADFDACVTERELREGEDVYVDELWGAAPSLGMALLAARVPRTYLDPNRHAGDVDPALLDGPWPWEYVPSGKARIGKSLVWRTLEDGRPIYARRLKPDEVKRRIDAFHTPYHEALVSLLDQSVQKNGRVYHINCHSMRSVAGKQSDDGEGRPRADFVLGDRDGTTCEPGFTAFVRERLVEMGYDVKVNDPYKGVELVRAYSNPAAGRHSLQIEIAKRLYMDEETLEKSPNFPNLQADLRALLESLKDYVNA
ncbi:MAG TPA: N-formylglutamate amidohydrolase [Burkholderiales bacterium]|nr:N-formylglutamate amidohydrolase [Burkholderiales bacterium]